MAQELKSLKYNLKLWRFITFCIGFSIGWMAEVANYINNYSSYNFNLAQENYSGFNISKWYSISQNITVSLWRVFTETVPHNYLLHTLWLH